MPGPSSHTSLSCSFPGVVPLFPFIAGTVPWLDSSWGLVEKWFLGIPPAGSWDPGTGILGSFTHRELEGGTIQTTTAAKVWQNQKYEEFITVGEKTAAGEDL